MLIRGCNSSFAVVHTVTAMNINRSDRLVVHSFCETLLTTIMRLCGPFLMSTELTAKKSISSDDSDHSSQGSSSKSESKLMEDCDGRLVPVVSPESGRTLTTP